MHDIRPSRKSQITVPVRAVCVPLMSTSQPNEPESYHSFQTAERNMRPMQRLDFPMSASKSREGRAYRGATNSDYGSSVQRRRRRVKTSERICDKCNTRPPTPYAVHRYFTDSRIHLSIHPSHGPSVIHASLVSNLWPSNSFLCGSLRPSFPSDSNHQSYTYSQLEQT